MNSHFFDYQQIKVQSNEISLNDREKKFPTNNESTKPYFERNSQSF